MSSHPGKELPESVPESTSVLYLAMDKPTA